LPLGESGSTNTPPFWALAFVAPIAVNVAQMSAVVNVSRVAKLRLMG
jgi:hypothetical protein